MRPTILIADDHGMLVDGLRKLLETDYEILGAVSDGRQILHEVQRLDPQLVVIDISMPSLNGIDATRQLREAGCSCKILILTMHPDATLAREALDAGASGYILKSSPASELLNAIKEVLLGRTFLSPAVTRDLLDIMGKSAASHDNAWAKLTPRQREVLQLLAEGKSHKEVAAILNVSVKTAEYHKYALLEALGLKTNAELVQYAVRHGIITV
ncbi:MAG: response regulator transcription factor [Bryobacterales bacterium]|nr:response regulator transcription factor [Bryobacterales bacterium]